MKPIIERLVLNRFLSVPSERIELDNPTILVGRNGAGKSNVVQAFAFLAEAMTSPLKGVFDRRGGIAAVRSRVSARVSPLNLGIAVTFGQINDAAKGGSYAFEVRAIPNHGFEVVREKCSVDSIDGVPHEFDRLGTKFSANVKGVDPSVDPAALCLPVVGGDSRFAPVLRALTGMRVYSINPGSLQTMQDPDSGSSLRSDGSNAASVLQEIERHSKESLETIRETLAAIVPGFHRVQPKKRGSKVSLEFTQQWGADDKKRLKFDASSMSDGTLRALGLLTAVYQKPSPTLLAIEEPEATIHPGALGVVLDLIRDASRRTQVVITTHSPEVLDAEWIEDRHLRIVEWNEGATRVTGLSDATRGALRDHLMGAGELLRSNALRPISDCDEHVEYRQGDLFGGPLR